MAFNFRLNVQSVFRRLGIQSGARLPQLEDDIRMVMVVTDLSRLIAAPIEPRGLAGVNIPGSTGFFSICQIESLAEGGIFVERLVFRGDGFPSDENYVIRVTVNGLTLPSLPGIQSVGGTPIRSEFSGGEILLINSGASVPAPSGKEVSFPEFGIFVPNQSFFTVSSSSKNKRLDVAIMWRELPSVEEVG